MTRIEKKDMNSISSSLLRLYDLFNNHPKKNNMNYCQHLTRALKLSVKMGIGSFYLFVHSILPFMFENNGSKIIVSLNEEIRHNQNNENK